MSGERNGVVSDRTSYVGKDPTPPFIPYPQDPPPHPIAASASRGVRWDADALRILDDLHAGREADFVVRIKKSMKTHLCKCSTITKPVLFRSRTPERVEQELCGLMRACNATRWIPPTRHQDRETRQQ